MGITTSWQNEGEDILAEEVIRYLKKNMNASIPSTHVRRFGWEHWL